MLGILGVRLIGLLFSVGGILYFAMWFLGSLSSRNTQETGEGSVLFWSAIVYMIFGIALFLLSRPFGKLLGRGISDI